MCIEECQKVGLCPEILMAVIEAESRGRADATCKDGCHKGLCQLSQKYFGGEGIDLYDPRTNIRIASEYLASLVERYGEIDIALGHYHGEASPETKMSNYTRKILERSAELERVHEGISTMLIRVTTNNEIEVMDYPKENDFEVLKELIGGYAEMVKPMRLYGDYGFNSSAEKGIVPVMLVDEEGLMKENIPLNFLASWLYGIDYHGSAIMGDVVFVGLYMGEDGADFCGLPIGLVQELERKLSRTRDKKRITVEKK